MHNIKKVTRIDYYLHVFFEDDSVRAIDLAPHFKIDLTTILNSELNTKNVPIHPTARSITWDDGSEISADFLYNNSHLIGWVDKKWGNNLEVWQPIGFNIAEVKVETNSEIHLYLLLDGTPFPALSISSASFGIYQNTAWYNVPFPGDEGVYKPEWEEPPLVFETLRQLVKMVDEALKAKVAVTINITERLQRTGRKLFVNSISPRNASICASHFKKNVS